MALKDYLPSQKDTPMDFYWSLIIEPGWVQAGIWKIEEDKTKVLSVSPSSAWKTDEELSEAADSALSAAVQDLPDDAPEPSKTVFGVSPTWVSDGSILPEFIEKIKNVSSKLSLTPAGFVVMPEAIAHHVKSKEGSPLNSVVVGVGGESIEVSLFLLGNLAGTQVVARSVSVGDDVIEGLSRFKHVENLPSRFLLYNGREAELEEARQSLMKIDWSKTENLKFLHTPNIEIIKPEEKVLAVSLAGASEISNVLSVEVEKTPEPEIQEEIEEVAPNIDTGFVVGQDLASSRVEVPEKVNEERQEIPREQVAEDKKPSGILVKLKSMNKKVEGAVGSIKPKVDMTGLTKVAGKKTFVFGVVALLLVFGGGFSYWWFYPKATVNIVVTPKKLEENIALFVDPGVSSIDTSKRILPGGKLEKDVSGEKTVPATGAKTVGDRAKGAVKMQNGTSEDIDLPTGTAIESSGGLRFTIDSATSIQAALSPSSPGTATVDVTAADIGAEYNLAGDESFSVSNYPKADVDAVATADFSGGSSRQILAVSEEDRDNLQEDLIDELLLKAEKELKSDLSDGNLLIEESLVQNVKDISFSKKVGDEAENLTLSLSLSVEALSVKKEDLLSLAENVLENKIPEGFVFRESQFSSVFEILGEVDGVYEVDTTFKVNLLPEIDPEEVAKKILGKYPPLAQEYLLSVPGFRRAEISLRPKFPGKLGTLPHVAKNLMVELSAEK